MAAARRSGVHPISQVELSSTVLLHSRPPMAQQPPQDGGQKGPLVAQWLKHLVVTTVEKGFWFISSLIMIPVHRWFSLGTPISSPLPLPSYFEMTSSNCHNTGTNKQNSIYAMCYLSKVIIFEIILINEYSLCPPYTLRITTSTPAISHKL